MKKTTFYKKMRYAMRRTTKALKEESWGFEAATNGEVSKWAFVPVWIFLFPLVSVTLSIAVVRHFVNEYKWAGELRETNYKKYLMEVL